MIVLDTSPILAAFDRQDPMHQQVQQVFHSIEEPLITTPLVLAEVDYLVTSRLGIQAGIDCLNELMSGRFEISHFGHSQIRQTIPVIQKYKDLRIGLTDASLVVLAHECDTQNIFTLDKRHFGTMKTLSGKPFTLFPNC